VRLFRRILRWYGFLPEYLTVASAAGFYEGMCIALYLPDGSTEKRYIHKITRTEGQAAT